LYNAIMVIKNSEFLIAPKFRASPSKLLLHRKN
jgi:hypothetical protein